MDLVEGGHSFTGRIIKVDPPRLLSFTWEGGSEVTFDLTPPNFWLLHTRLEEDYAN